MSSYSSYTIKLLLTPLNTKLYTSEVVGNRSKAVAILTKKTHTSSIYKEDVVK
jgi:hypothetical protein